MRSLIVVLTLSLVSHSSFAQLKTKKYLRANKEPERIIIQDNKSHSRALLVDGDKLLTGSSDGSIYLHKLESDEQILLFQQPSIKEIRDIEKVSDGYIAMQSANSSKLISISNNGNLKILKEPQFDEVFLDGMDFNGEKGFLMGDPHGGFFNLFTTTNGGKTWTRTEGNVEAHPDEAAFAASGSTVHLLNDSTLTFVSGGMTSRFFISTDFGATWTITTLPYYPGPSIGPYSLCFASDSSAVMVGGDYKDIDLKLNSSFYSKDGGMSWLNPENPTRGYRSCVIEHQGIYYCCGSNGIDISENGGKDWAAFADGNYISLAVWNGYLIASTAQGEIHFYKLIES